MRISLSINTPLRSNISIGVDGSVQAADVNIRDVKEAMPVASALWTIYKASGYRREAAMRDIVSQLSPIIPTIISGDAYKSIDFFVGVEHDFSGIEEFREFVYKLIENLDTCPEFTLASFKGIENPDLMGSLIRFLMDTEDSSGQRVYNFSQEIALWENKEKLAEETGEYKKEVYDDLGNIVGYEKGLIVASTWLADLNIIQPGWTQLFVRVTDPSSAEVFYLAVEDTSKNRKSPIEAIASTFRVPKVYLRDGVIECIKRQGDVLMLELKDDIDITKYSGRELNDRVTLTKEQYLSLLRREA